MVERCARSMMHCTALHLAHCCAALKIAVHDAFAELTPHGTLRVCKSKQEWEEKQHTFSSTLEGLRSLCTMPLLCTYAMPAQMSCRMFMMASQRCGRLVSLNRPRRIALRSVLPLQYSCSSPL